MENLKPNEILCPAQRVKYFSVEYYDKYIVVEQNQTRRRVPKGYYFDDDGIYIYLSTFYSVLFQHKQKIRYFVLNKDTKEWRDWQSVFMERHTPEKKEALKNNIIEELKK